MPTPLPRLTLSAFFTASLLAAVTARADLAQLQQQFAAPPDDARPMVRWWWFGPAVVQDQLAREMNFMKEGGFGGFEVQPTYPLALDDEHPGLKNYRFLSPEHLDALGFTAAKAKELGLRMDLTLGSGWPYGGPMFTRAEASQRIATTAVPVTAGQSTVAAPAGGRGGRGAAAAAPVGPIAAALLGPVNDAPAGASPYVPLAIRGNEAVLPANLRGATQVLFFTPTLTGLNQVKRPAFGADGFIIDHYDSAAIAKFIKEIAEPTVLACGPNPPYSLFCDSLEMTGEDWTPNFLAEFKQRRGYDLTPWLPALFGDLGPKTSEICHDWGQTITEMFNENFCAVFTKFAASHQSRFRIQAYGTPPANLATYAYADLDEAEGLNWRGFDRPRWASSASHLLGRPVTSSETWTWLHQAVFLATPLDMKAEADIHFLQGINQLIGHGWPYTHPAVPYPGWRFYAAAVFNEKNPWWIVMPDVNKYLQRVSFLLRQGRPANDVALYLPEADAWSAFRPGSVSMSGIAPPLIRPAAANLLQWGYNFDAFDDALLKMRGKVDGPALVFGDLQYRAIVLPGVTRMPPETLRQLAAFADAGGILIASRSLPTLAPGLLATAADQQYVTDTVARLFTAPNAKGIFVESDDQVGAALAKKLRPDVALDQANAEIGFVHRSTPDGEVYFLANTANEPRTATGIFRVTGRQPEWWDPMTGQVAPAQVAQVYADSVAVNLDFPAYGSRVLVFSNRQLPAPPAVTATAPAPLDLSRGWDVTFKNANPANPDPAPVRLDQLVSWNETPAMQYFSGTATYVKDVTVTPAMLQAGLRQRLTFGAGQSGAAAGGGRGGGNGMRANYVSPVREAAVVYVNGQRAGAAWAPPFSVDVTGLLKPGANQIKIVAANLAANDMAAPGHWQPNEQVLDQTFGNRFDQQNMQQIQSLPSGLLGPIQLVAARPSN